MSSFYATAFRPSKDLMCKAAACDPSVINIITNALIGTKDGYLVGENEWYNGTGSDLVLEPKYVSTDLRPIVVEF